MRRAACAQPREMTRMEGERASDRRASAPDRRASASDRPTEAPERLIAIDVGAGTSDIVIRSAGEPVENSVKLVVPSPTRVVAARIRGATRAGAAVVFYGRTMGGGADTRAMKAHTAAGLPFLATPAAARTFADDLERVRACGVEIVSDEEADAVIRAGRLHAGRASAVQREVVAVRAGDVDAPALLRAMEALGIPSDFCGAAIAVQDHGFTPDGSNRAYRFSLWERAVCERRSLPELFYRADLNEVPERLTRLQAAVACLAELLACHYKSEASDTGTALPILAGDTGPAALLGALTDAPAAHPPTAPRVLVNVGNGHTIAVVERAGRLAGVYEHHTGLLDGKQLRDQLQRFLAGRLTTAEVRDDGGHGAVINEPVDGDLPLLVTGPNRHLLDRSGFRTLYPAPWGDMMIAGAVGLLEAFAARSGVSKCSPFSSSVSSRSLST